MDGALLHLRPQRNRTTFASFWSIRQRSSLFIIVSGATPWAVHLAFMHGSLPPWKFENTWRVSPCYLNFHSLWWIATGKQCLAWEKSFQSWGNSEPLQLMLKLWCCHRASPSREFAKLKEKRERERERERFSTKGMSHCSKDSWLNCWALSLAVLCRNHTSLKIQFIGGSWNMEI